ncbi:MAG: hypothetical protein IJ292_02070 [Clostridia bacterium]|nr:hypothetical protein [Clostridia bacterium]
MKYRNCIKWAVVLLLLLVCAISLFSCKNNESPNVDNPPKPTDTSEPAVKNPPRREISKYRYDLYISRSDKEIVEVITSTEELENFLNNKDIDINALSTYTKYKLYDLKFNYSESFFENNNLIVCISKRGDFILYGDIFHLYGNKEQIDIVFRYVNNNSYSEFNGHSSSVVFEVSKDVCDRDTKVDIKIFEELVDPLTYPDQWISEKLNTQYNYSFPKYYPDEFYNIAILGFLCDTDKVDEYLNNGFKKEYNGLTPPIYMFIRHLNVDRQEFLKTSNKLNDYNLKYEGNYPEYNAHHINIMFSCDEIDVRKQLCKDNYVYCGGVFYDYMESDLIFFKDQAHTFKEWCWIFFEDMELYNEFLCYADSKAYARFKYEMLKPGSFSEILDKAQEENNVYKDKIRRSFTVLEHKIENENKLVYNSKKGELSRYYDGKLVNNGFPSVFFRVKEVREYYYNNYLYKTSAEELNYLPTAYYLIRDLNLKARTEEFRQENEYRITTTDDMTRFFLDLKHFEYLFGNYDEETLKKELKYPTVFYFEGKLYDLEDLQDADSALLDKMGAGTEFKDYLTDLKRMRVYKESEEVYGELVDGWLEKYYGIKD